MAIGWLVGPLSRGLPPQLLYIYIIHTNHPKKRVQASQMTMPNSPTPNTNNTITGNNMNKQVQAYAARQPPLEGEPAEERRYRMEEEWQERQGEASEFGTGVLCV